MVVVPGAIAETLPDADTAATFASLLVHVIARFDSAAPDASRSVAVKPLTAPGASVAAPATDTVATLAVFSHLDVPPLLHNLVFGESVLNDAVAIVLFRTLVEFYDTPLSAVTPLAVAA